MTFAPAPINALPSRLCQATVAQVAGASGSMSLFMGATAAPPGSPPS